MSFNKVGNILCQRCQNFVDGFDCSKCGWEQPSYEENPLDEADARIEKLEDMLSRLVKENDLAMPNENYQWVYSPMRVECLKLLESK